VSPLFIPLLIAFALIAIGVFILLAILDHLTPSNRGPVWVVDSLPQWVGKPTAWRRRHR